MAEHPGHDVPVADGTGQSGQSGQAGAGAGGAGPDFGGGEGGHRLPSAYVVAVTNAAGVLAYGRFGRHSGRPAATAAVVDTGDGMSTPDARRVFERFYRVDRARTHDDGGTGLGLSIVAALVTEHHGSVDVRTPPGPESRFVVELPLSGV